MIAKDIDSIVVTQKTPKHLFFKVCLINYDLHSEKGIFISWDKNNLFAAVSKATGKMKLSKC